MASGGHLRDGDTDPMAEGAQGGGSGPGGPRATSVFTLTDAVVSDTHFTTAVKVWHTALKRGIIKPLFPKHNLPSSHGTELF